MRELQCVSQLRWGAGRCVVSGYTHEDMGEMSLLKMPRSVDWLILEVGLGIGQKMIVMDYVGCARTVQVTPGRRSALSIVICGTFGYTEGHNKSTPVESNGMPEMSLVDRQLRNVWAYGNTEQPASVKWTVIGRDALGIRRGKLPRSTICEMQARNRLLEYANCVSMALDVLAGRFKYYSWRSCKMRCMCLLKVSHSRGTAWRLGLAPRAKVLGSLGKKHIGR